MADEAVKIAAVAELAQTLLEAAGRHSSALQTLESRIDQKKAQLDAQIIGLDDRINVRNHGALGNGSDATSALKLAVKAVGSEIYIPDGDYRLSDTIVLPNNIRRVTCAPNARLIQTENKPIFYKRGVLAPSSVAIVNPSIPAGNKTVSVSPANSGACSSGDWILIRSNDLTPNVTAGSRNLFLRRVTAVSVGSGVIYFDAAIFRAMTTGMSIRRVTLGSKVVFAGGTYTSKDQENTKPLFEFVLCESPDFNGVSIRDSGATGIKLAHCVGGSFNFSEIYNLRDDRATGHYGYGVALNGATRGFMFNSGSVGHVRHAITTATFQEAFEGNDQLGPLTTEEKAYIEVRGEPEACYYGPVYCYNTTNAAFDLHEQGYGFVITPNAHGCFEGIHIRSGPVSIVGGQVIGCRRNGMRVSYPASNPKPTVDYKISVKGLTINTVAPDGEGGEESAGLNVLAAGAELDIENLTVSGYREFGIRAQPGTKLIIRGGTFDGQGIAGNVAIQLESSDNIIRGPLIRNNGTGIKEVGSVSNNERADIIFSGNGVNEVLV